MNLTKKAEKQQSLALTATAQPAWRFTNLYSLMHWDYWIDAAAQTVLSRPGSDTAGVDGDTRQSFRRNYEGQLASLVTELKGKSYTPLPTKRVYIPKPDGTKRPLGIPALRDRIVQEALRAILDPIYESDFDQQSYGFRKGRSTIDAISYLMPFFNNSNKYFYVIEGDLQSYFDTVHHRTLLKLLRRRIQDRALLDLITSFLKAGVLKDGIFAKTPEGVPQGGILSPLLSNVYLHEFDQWAANRWMVSTHQHRTNRSQGLGNFKYVRYADDFVVICNGPIAQVREAKEEIQHYLANQLHLTLNVDKTRITHVNDGFDFLGFNIRRRRNHNDKMVTHLRPSAKSIARVKRKIKELTTRSTTWVDHYTRLTTLNIIVIGWANYYAHTAWVHDIDSLTRYVWFRYLGWLQKKHPRTGKGRLIREHQGRYRGRLRWQATVTQGDKKLVRWQWQPTRQEYNRKKIRRQGADSFPHPYLIPTTLGTDYHADPPVDNEGSDYQFDTPSKGKTQICEVKL